MFSLSRYESTVGFLKVNVLGHVGCVFENRYTYIDYRGAHTSCPTSVYTSIFQHPQKVANILHVSHLGSIMNHKRQVFIDLDSMGRVVLSTSGYAESPPPKAF